MRPFAALLALAIVTALPSAVIAFAPATFDDEAAMTDCLELAGPGEASAGFVLPGDDVTLDVLLLVDSDEGATIQQMTDPDARAAAEAAHVAEVQTMLAEGAESYTELGIDLVFTDDSTLLNAFKPNGERRSREDGQDAADFIQMGKDQLGGARPAHADLVYVATDIGTGSTVGLADCIGGVELDDRAFAMGSLNDYGTTIVVPFSSDTVHKTFAHELGHLMGAHHHYQSCGDGAAHESNQTNDVGPCSMMTNFVNFQLAHFSPVNSAVVRGHAEAFAAGNDG